MKRKTPTNSAPVADPAFAEIDSIVEQAEAEFKAVLGMVKPAHRARFLTIVEHSDAYCMNHLQPLHREYETMCHVMVAALCGKGHRSWKVRPRRKGGPRRSSLPLVG